MQEMLLWGFNELDLNKIWLRVEVDHERAIKSYKRMGFVEEGILRQDRLRKGEFVDRLRMSILKDEFFSKRANRTLFEIRLDATFMRMRMTL